MSVHMRSVLQALLVTFLWSTSVILIKVGLQTLPALTFAGLRYSLAFTMLLPLMWRTSRRGDAPPLTRATLWQLAALGVMMYTLTQGAQFVALQYLPAATHSMMLNGTPVIVLAMGSLWLSEYPTRLQLMGLGVFFVGLVLYFAPAGFAGTQLLGLAIAAFQVIANAGTTVLGRAMNRTRTIPALTITTISMGIGAVVLLVTGVLLEGIPRLGWQSALLVLWLAGVNTAFAFTLWNHTQRTLSAMASSMINNTMLVQIGLMAWLFLGEALSLQAVVGMVVATVGILLVQLRR